MPRGLGDLLLSVTDHNAHAGREPITFVQLRLTRCDLTYGSAPCTASGPTANRCYNTRATCQDTANFSANIQTLTFCDHPRWFECSGADFPGSFSYPPPRPCLKTINFTPPKIEPGKGLGALGGCEIVLDDFYEHEFGVDASHNTYQYFWDDTDPYWRGSPYYAGRAASPKGTYFARLLARNPHFAGREVRVWTGFLGGSWTADFTRRDYVIETIDGPGADHRVRIQCSDPLRLAADDRAAIPLGVSSTLATALGAADTTVVLDDGSDFDSGLGYVRIEDEIIGFITRSTNTLTGCVRGMFNTVAEAHDLGETVQQCRYLPSRSAPRMIHDLLRYYTSINYLYFSTANFDSEGWLENTEIAALIVDPVSVAALIREIAAVIPLSVWWDEVNRVVRCRSLAPIHPGETVETIADDEMIEGTLRIKRLSRERISRVQLFFGERNPLEGDGPENWSDHYIKLDAARESSDMYGTVRERVLKCRWLKADDLSAVVTAVGRIIQRWGDDPLEIVLQVDAADGERYRTGDSVLLQTIWLTDAYGDPRTLECQVMSASPTKGHVGSRVTIELMSLGFAGRYAYIAPTGTDYGAASDAWKGQYAWIAPATGNFADGGEPYKIV